MTDVPSLKWFLHPLLTVFERAGVPLSRGELRTLVFDLMELSDEQRQIRIPSGHGKARHRAGWALVELKQAGLVERRQAGWSITAAGQAVLREHPRCATDDEVAQLRRELRTRRQVEAADEAAAASPASPAALDEDQGPEEAIEEALSALRESVASELLELLGNSDPYFFERVVLDVLHAMGYGANRDALTQVGGSGDGGIDGIVSIDRLGLEKVYVQAKRWQANVGRPEIQAFFGALSGRRASKGVFITTSAFTREAREYARSVSDTLVLVGGRELAGLMMEYGVGVTRKPQYLPSVDSDYFEE